MERNPVGWFEIYVSDMARAVAFYEAVLGVKLEKLDAPMPELEMMAFSMNDDRPGAAGALARMPGVSPSVGGTLVYFSCEDCADEASRVAASGGRVIQDKFPIGEYGFIAMIEDTEGNMVGLHSVK